MMRMAIAMLALISMVTGPAASAACLAGCAVASEHRSVMCHEKAHAQLGPHIHQAGHIHQMFVSDRDLNTNVATHPDHQHQCVNSSMCDTFVCRADVKARPMRAVLCLEHRVVLSRLPVSALSHAFLPDNASDGHNFDPKVTASPLIPSVPLRV